MGYEITQFPIPNLYESYEFLINNLHDLLSHSNRIEKLLIEIFESVLNALVFNLYFPDHMKERGIDVLEFVERDIEEVMQGKDFEQLSEAEKNKVIEQLHARWSDPENEVVRRMGLFKEKSPDILKVILES